MDKDLLSAIIQSGALGLLAMTLWFAGKFIERTVSTLMGQLTSSLEHIATTISDTRDTLSDLRDSLDSHAITAARQHAEAIRKIESVAAETRHALNNSMSVVQGSVLQEIRSTKKGDMR